MDSKEKDGRIIEYNRLGYVLVEKKVSQKVLSILMNVNESTVSRWKTNKQQPTIAQMYEIARVLKADFQTMFVEAKWKPGPSEAEIYQAQRKTEQKISNPDKFKSKKKSDH